MMYKNERLKAIILPMLYNLDNQLNFILEFNTEFREKIIDLKEKILYIIKLIINNNRYDNMSVLCRDIEMKVGRIEMMLEFFCNNGTRNYLDAYMTLIYNCRHIRHTIEDLTDFWKLKEVVI